MVRLWTLTERVAKVVGVQALQAPPVQQPLGHETVVHWHVPPKHSRLVSQDVWSAAAGVEHTPVPASHDPRV